MEAFRERFCAKVEKGPFWDHLTLRNLERDETRFHVFDPETLRKPMLFGTFCLTAIFQHLVGFHLFGFIYKRNGFLIILDAFWAFSQRH